MKRRTNCEKTLVLIDYANFKASAKYLNKKVDLKKLYSYLNKLDNVAEVNFYYGIDPRNPKSANFIKSLAKTGYEVVTKEVKYIKVRGRDLSGNYVITEQPKCNLDIEIALDIYSNLDNYDSFMLFSGDGDFASIMKIARAHKKYCMVVSLRKFLAGELIHNADEYTDLKKFNLLANFLY